MSTHPNFTAGTPGAGFVAGFAARNAGVAALLQQAFGQPHGFAPSDLAGRGGPRSFHPVEAAPEPAADVPTIDPVAEAYAAGHADALAAFAADTERDRALADNIARALSHRVDRDRIARQLRQTVLLLVTRMVGEAGIAADLLAQRVEAATDLLTDAAESALLRVHPDDVALLEGRLPATVFAVGDAAVARGSFVMESASTIVEDGPELWLDQLTQAIDRVAVPGAGTH